MSKSILIVVRSVFFLGLLQGITSPAETVAVRYREGVSHGFLVLRTQEGKPIADGDSTQVAQGDRVTSRMRFRFKESTSKRLFSRSTAHSDF